MFANLPLNEQLDAWLGPRAHAPLESCPDGDVVVRRAVLGAHAFTVVAFDYARHHGSIGPMEAAQVAHALRHAGAEHHPLVFLMNTSGMRVTAGMDTVAALRTLLRDLLDARLAGQRLFATVTRHAFGGASMIASLCDRRTMHAGALLGMSGPKLIERIAGSQALRASDADAVAALLGGAARASVTGTTLLCEDSAAACRLALSSWLDETAPEFTPEARVAEPMAALRARLGDRVLPPPASAAPGTLDATTVELLDRLLPGAKAELAGSVLFARAPGTDGSIVCGLVGGGAATAPAALALMEALLAAAGTRTGLRISILADVENHSADPADERVVLSEYLAQLALTLRLLHRRGNDVHVIVTGIAGGGIFAALAAGATRVGMLPRARLQVLSPAALAALGMRADTDDETLGSALAAGAVDGAFPDARAHA
jgi:hypothetical protein